ncbi:MAG: hypothetical protein MMC33_010915 [Icmadophila ericetorum]|nr:hypothetical protein [Icmadophila ericetorum]
MPLDSPWTHHVLGPGSSPTDPDLASPQEDEAKIALLMLAVDHLLDCCEETMRHTGRTILCWLRSTKPQSCYPKPFTLFALKSSKKKYRQLLKRFFAFIFRAYRMPVDVRRHLTGVRFKKEQLRQIRLVREQRAWSDVDLAQGGWPGSEDEGNYEGDVDDEGGDEAEDETDGEEDDEDDEDTESDSGEGAHGDDDGERTVGRWSEDEYQEEAQSDNAGAVGELLELVFQLSITFSTEEFLDGQPSSTLLVFISGILGFSPDTQSFLPAKKYTTHLSGFIYIQRLLFLERALPLRPYPHLQCSQPLRFAPL